MASPRVEPLYVLYGSQMGNSEQAAKDFCRQVKTKYTPEFFKSNGLSPIEVKTTCMQLDDFLEIDHANFTKCLVIFVSSYGVGQAPLGSARFREICEAFLAEEATYKGALTGLKYAICGLGSSNYTTFLRNPTTIDKGLKVAGALPVLDMGKADAVPAGDDAQDKRIARWVEKSWVPLATALSATDEVDTKSMQDKIIPLLVKLDPDYTPPKMAGGSGTSPMTIAVAILTLLVVAAAIFMAQL